MSTLNNGRIQFPLVAMVGLLIVLGFVLAPAPGGPPIAWTPAAVNEAIPAGANRTVSVSFVSSQNLSNVEVRAVPALQAYVQASPASFPNLIAGQTYVVNLALSAPPTATPGSIDGVIQLRRNGQNTIARPLPVSLNVTWQSFEGATGEVAFEYPSFGLPTRVAETSTVEGARFDIMFQLPGGSEPAPQFGLLALPNTDRQSINEWFYHTVDPSGELLSLRVYEPYVTPGGISALVLSNTVPDQSGNQYGPVATIYGVSPTGNTIVVFNVSQDTDLGTLGVPGSDYSELLKAVLATLRVP